MTYVVLKMAVLDVGVAGGLAGVGLNLIRRRRRKRLAG